MYGGVVTSPSERDVSSSAPPTAIHLQTEIPGPKSRALVARREAASAPGAAKLTPIAIASAHGAVVTDVDGNRFLDLAGGIGTLAVGHTPAGVVAALQAQAEKLIHMCAIVATYEPAVALCERLNALAPGDFPKRSVLMNSGAEALETAVHICRSYTKRQGIVVVEGAYHGRTNLTMAMTSKFNLFKKGFGPFAPEVYRFPFPNLYRRPAGMTPEGWTDWHVANLEHAFTAIVEPSHVAAVVIEPVLGEGGFLPVPAPFLRRLRELCDRHGMVLVFDEIQSGMGRTGKLWASEHSGVVPDLLATAKSLGGGMPISAIVGRAGIMEAPHPGGLGGTFSGNPLACVAALAVLDELAQPAFLQRATQIGQRLERRLSAIQAAHPRLIGDVRGLGPMLAMELVKDPMSKEPCLEATQAVNAGTLQRGVITIRAGLFSNCVRLLPPLNISDAELDEAMDVLSSTVDVVAAELGVAGAG
jgi:4-aminobutyrate aminotransferase/(S)-3-amino-2-methylpropionate transaminase